MRFHLLFLFIPLLLSCSDKGDLVTTEPTNADVAGRYELSSTYFNSSIDDEISSKSSSIYIELEKNGTLMLHNFPVVPETDSKSYSIERFHTGIGTYTIAPLGSNSTTEFYGLYLKCGDLPNPCDTPRLRKDGDRLMLSFEYFNGDFTQRMVFTRSQ